LPDILELANFRNAGDPDQVDRQDETEVFLRSDGTWKLKISRSSPHKNPES
jgi:hypothetical protein